MSDVCFSISDHTHRRRNDIQSGGAKFWKSKMGAKAPAVALARCRGLSEGGCAPLRSRSFFENIVLNEAIWCTIFHHFKHLTASLQLGCLLPCLLQNKRVKKKKKWRGHAPPVWKVEGPLAPLATPVPPPMDHMLILQVWKMLNVFGKDKKMLNVLSFWI